jgi:CMP-N-acetylneuraminic acid synthetase/spore coat polysaccharide biosynthesis predicted glycosyltransferase SpsG
VTDRPLLAIVPARAGSKGVPHKNTRLLGDRPLVAHTVETLDEAGVADRLLVSSDDEQILRWCEAHSIEAHHRPPELAGDEVTISDLAAAIADELDWEGDVGVFQPTSPFRTVEATRRAVEEFRAGDHDSLATVVREPHLFWLDENDDLARAKPLFAERVNRQLADQRVMRETGSIQLVRSEALRSGRQVVTERHRLFETDAAEALDIDTRDELVVARRRLDRGSIVFRLQANRRIGSGHVYHCLQLADELADQELGFLLKDCDDFVSELVTSHGYEWRTETDLAADLEELRRPGVNLVVNDKLETSEEEVLTERALGYRVVNIEDLGPGSRLADWVVNALYDQPNSSSPNTSSGAAYATLRSEFFHMPEKQTRAQPERILLAFGGTDPGHLAARCARILDERVDCEIRAVLGPGAEESGFPDEVAVVRRVRSMAAEMHAADLIITSAGRTVYEAAVVGTPVAVLAQGARDATHAHLSFDFGVVFLGIGPLVDDEHIAGVVVRLLGDAELRAELSERLRRSIDLRGTTRIGDGIRAILKGL